MKTLNDLYTSLLRGDYKEVVSSSSALMINDIALELLKAEPLTKDQIQQCDLVLRISNILYNNTDLDMLPLEDGTYDILLEKYKKYNPNFQVGAEVINFHPSSRGESEERYIQAIVSYPQNLVDAVFAPTFTSIIPDRSQQYLDNKHKSRTDRNRDTNHRYPELVGTLDKCKFVTDADAKNAMVYKDPNVKIFERDFLAEHVYAGILNYNTPFELVAEIKYDGVSIEAEVSNHVVTARTRGDLENDLATDLTDIFYGYRFPNDIPDDEIFGMKFEAIITKQDLILLERETGKSYKNMRTAVSGILGLSNARDYLKYITLVPLATSLEFNSRIEELEFINRFFATKEINRYWIIQGTFAQNVFQVKSIVKEAEMFRDYMQFAYDGIVVSYTDKNIINFLGRKNFVNKYSVAIKFGALVKKTRFRGYEYTVGKNGVITPMILFDPIEFNGTIHTIASGHSYERFKKLGLHYGDILEVAYVNDVMPYVMKGYHDRLNDVNGIEEFISHCPECGSVLSETESGKSVICRNMKCKGRIFARLDDMMKKLNFKDFTGATLRSLQVTSFTELMTITDDRLEVLGETNSVKFRARLTEFQTKPLYDYELIGALGFTDVSTKSWKAILHEFTIKELLNLSEMDPGTFANAIIAVRGIGKTTVSTIISELDTFKNDIVFISNMPNVSSSKASAPTMKIVMTGFRDEELVNQMKEKGIELTGGSVTKDAALLVIPYKGFTSSKVDKANKYKVPITSVEDFRLNYLKNGL